MKHNGILDYKNNNYYLYFDNIKSNYINIFSKNKRYNAIIIGLLKDWNKDILKIQRLYNDLYLNSISIQFSISKFGISSYFFIHLDASSLSELDFLAKNIKERLKTLLSNTLNIAKSTQLEELFFNILKIDGDIQLSKEKLESALIYKEKNKFLLKLNGDTTTSHLIPTFYLSKIDLQPFLEQPSLFENFLDILYSSGLNINLIIHKSRIHLNSFNLMYLFSCSKNIDNINRIINSNLGQYNYFTLKNEFHPLYLGNILFRKYYKKKYITKNEYIPFIFKLRNNIFTNSRGSLEISNQDSNTKMNKVFRDLDINRQPDLDINRQQPEIENLINGSNKLNLFEHTLANFDPNLERSDNIYYLLEHNLLIFKIDELSKSIIDKLIKIITQNKSSLIVIYFHNYSLYIHFKRKLGFNSLNLNKRVKIVYGIKNIIETINNFISNKDILKKPIILNEEL